MQKKLALKKRLLLRCIEMIELRIATSAKAVENAQSAANAEEKSSAGDKYETSRAMNQLEKDMHSRQLAANRTELAALPGIDRLMLQETVSIGSMAVCRDYSFFIAAGLGRIDFEGKIIYLLSPQAPMAKTLMKKTAGNLIVFNGKEITIMVVF